MPGDKIPLCVKCYCWVTNTFLEYSRTSSNYTDCSKLTKFICLCQWRSQRGVWGVQTPSIEKGVHFYCLVIGQKQWLIIKIVATRCRILRLKCTKFRFRLGLHPNPAGRAHSTPSDTLAGFKGSYFRLLLREGEGAEGKRGGEGEKGEREMGARTPSITNFWLRHWFVCL